MGSQDVERRVCAPCGARLGVYEPILALADTNLRPTSLPTSRT